ncbi:hypothetical protein [Borreliella andersonii]
MNKNVYWLFCFYTDKIFQKFFTSLLLEWALNKMLLKKKLIKDKD